jgi:cobalt-zinc-cadmium efflux system outer membrane protein
MRHLLPWLLVALASTADAKTLRLTLPEAERVMLARNRELASAQAAVAVAEAERQIAGQLPNPDFTFQQDHIPLGARNGYAGSAASPVSTPEAPSTRFLVDNAAYAGLSWKIEIGKRGHRQASAGYNIVASRQTAADLLRQKRGDLHEAFVEALRAGEELDLARAVLSSQEETLRATEARAKAGAIPESDVIKLRLELRVSQNDLADMELALTRARLALRQLLGLRDDEQVEPVGQLLDERLTRSAEEPVPSVAALVERARGLRPDLAALYAQHARAEAEIHLARALKIPDITLQVGYLWDAPNSYLSYGFTIPLPVFNRYPGEEAKARHESRRIAADLLATRARIAAQVREALARLRAARALVARYRNGYLDQAAESRQIAEAAYRRGQTSILELLETQRTYVAVRREWIRAHAELRLSAARLTAAVGEQVFR